MNKIKDKIHIILYFINRSSDIFYDFEVPMMEEIINHKDSKVIYVITHSYMNMNNNKKIDYINKINNRIEEISKKYIKKLVSNKNNRNNVFASISDDDRPIKIYNEENFEQEKKEFNEKMKASLDNVVFVNFHKTILDESLIIPASGIDNLFKTIKKYFMETPDYKSSCEKLTQEKINENAEKLKARAKDIVLSNKVWGGIIGIIPGVDWAVQKFVIKKNALKKIAQIFEIDVSFIDEIEEKNKKNEKLKNKLENISSNKNINENKINGEQLIEEDSEEKKGTIINESTKGTSYISATISAACGVMKTPVGEAAASQAVTTALGTGLKVVGAGFFVVGAVTGVAMGAYYTNKFCNDLIEKFTEYYKKNKNNIVLSYQEVIEYFEVRKN